MKLSDTEIVAGLLRSDAKTLEYLYRHLGPMVLAYTIKNSGSKEEGEELLQEVIVAVWENICKGKYNDQNKFNQYFVSVARNKWRDKLRKRKGLPVSGISLEDTQIADNSQEQREDKAEKERAIEQLEAALEQLKVECREVLKAFHFDGKKLKDIAEEKGISHGAMRKRIHDCREKLRKLLRNGNHPTS